MIRRTFQWWIDLSAVRQTPFGKTPLDITPIGKTPFAEMTLAKRLIIDSMDLVKNSYQLLGIQICGSYSI